MNEIKTCLIKMRELLSNEENWTRGYFARDLFNQECPILDKNAHKFCIMGAMVRVVRVTYPDLSAHNNISLRSNIHFMLQKRCSHALTVFNDIGSHAQVLQLIDDTIKDLED